MRGRIAEMYLFGALGKNPHHGAGCVMRAASERPPRSNGTHMHMLPIPPVAPGRPMGSFFACGARGAGALASPHVPSVVNGGIGVHQEMLLF